MFVLNIWNGGLEKRQTCENTFEVANPTDYNLYEPQHQEGPRFHRQGHPK